MHICRKISDVDIYALYPESFCGENLAIRKVFAFSDSAVRGSVGGFVRGLSGLEAGLGGALDFK